MIWTSIVLYQLYIIVMYVFQGVTLFSICCLIKFTEGADDRRNSLSRGEKQKTKNEKEKPHTQKFSCSPPMGVSVLPSIHRSSFYSAPPKLFSLHDVF